jgi:hypothetical protein
MKKNHKILEKLKLIKHNEGLYILILRVVNFLLKKFKINIYIPTPIEKLKKNLSKKIISLAKNRVMYGIYKDTYFSEITYWHDYDFSNLFLGCYELQVQNKILDVQNKLKLKNIINIGSGIGYHIISLLKKDYFYKGYAFETNIKGQEIIRKNAILNNIDDKIKILGEGNFISIKNNINNSELSNSLFLIDIEGGEFSFFTKENINFFKESYFIIEEHDIYDDNKIKNFYDLVNNNFIIEKIKNSSRNPFEYQILDKFRDDEKFLMMSEGRSESMNWLYLRPKLLTTK